MKQGVIELTLKYTKNICHIYNKQLNYRFIGSYVPLQSSPASMEPDRSLSNVSKIVFHWCIYVHRDWNSFRSICPLRSRSNIAKQTTTTNDGTTYQSLTFKVTRIRGPKVWDSLPNNIKEISSIGIFKTNDFYIHCY